MALQSGRRRRSRRMPVCPFAQAEAAGRHATGREAGQAMEEGDGGGDPPGRWRVGRPGSRRRMLPPCLAAEPVVDEGRLAELRAVIGHDHVALIFGAFCDSVPENIRDMRAAIAAYDDAALHEAAHRLKGTAGMLGLARLEGVLRAVCGLASGRPGEGSLAALSAALDAAVSEALDVAREMTRSGRDPI